MSDDEMLKILIKDIVSLLKELQISLNQKINEIEREVVKVEDIRDRLRELEEWKKEANSLLQSLCSRQDVDEAVNVYIRSQTDKEESRSYAERKELGSKVWDIGLKVAGVLALLGFIMQQILK